MVRSSFLGTLVVAVLGLSCGSVRGASVGDLVDPVADTPPDADAGGPPRLTVKCATPPNPAASQTVTVPEGAFPMGCNPTVDKECRKDELPTHMVTLHAFDIDVTE